MTADNIRSIGIIGAGTMGSGIASAAAISGYRSVIFDISPDALVRSKERIVKGYGRLVEKGKLDIAKKDSAVNLVLPSSDFDSLSECDIIIEAAIENLDLKKDVYRRLDEMTRHDTILATNTSSFSITAISSAVKNNSGRVIGMHFFNPASIMKLVEVIKGEFTSDETVNAVIELCKKLGKVPVVCNDTPAFIVNRVARAFYGESLKIMGEEQGDPLLID
ncbi:MAG: 3-hydroxybutyryl-CoA dehydrogenase, partial [Ignavibacteria bacterium]|nr:3-hydroxybutyryl-CoA dehydrogenase [Ignavibacteria bacterium]